MSDASAMPREGLLLFAHGARDPNWARPFEAVRARLLERTPGVEVRLAFLELMAPDLATAGAELVAAGCASVTIERLFLGAGGHVRKDLPALAEALARAHPATLFRLAPALGEHPLVIDALAAAAALSRPPASPPHP